MSSTTGEVQPVLSVPWAPKEVHTKEALSVPTVVRTEGGTAEVGEFGANSRGGFPAPPPEFSAEVIEQIQTFLKEDMGIELNLIAEADGRTIVEFVDSKTGKVIRRMSQEKASPSRNKIEKHRGVLFDGKA